MRAKLASILGLKIETSEQDIIKEVEKLVFDLRSKQGFVYGGIIKQLTLSGFFKFDDRQQCWVARISERTMENFINNQ